MKDSVLYASNILVQLTNCHAHINTLLLVETVNLQDETVNLLDETVNPLNKSSTTANFGNYFETYYAKNKKQWSSEVRGRATWCQFGPPDGFQSETTDEI